PWWPPPRAGPGRSASPTWARATPAASRRPPGTSGSTSGNRRPDPARGQAGRRPGPAARRPGTSRAPPSGSVGVGGAHVRRRVELAQEARRELLLVDLGEQAACLVVVDPLEDPPDGHPVRGHGGHGDLVAGRDRPGGEHARVRARAALLGEPAHPPGALDAAGERLAR